MEAPEYLRLTGSVRMTKMETIDIELLKAQGYKEDAFQTKAFERHCLQRNLLFIIIFVSGLVYSALTGKVLGLVLSLSVTIPLLLSIWFQYHSKLLDHDTGRPMVKYRNKHPAKRPFRVPRRSDFQTVQNAGQITNPPTVFREKQTFQQPSPAINLSAKTSDRKGFYRNPRRAPDETPLHTSNHKLSIRQSPANYPLAPSGPHLTRAPCLARPPNAPRFEISV